MLRQRLPASSRDPARRAQDADAATSLSSAPPNRPMAQDDAGVRAGETEPLLQEQQQQQQQQQPGRGAEESSSPPERAEPWVRRNQWVVLAVASGACAAFNGAFAKLTTTQLTGRLAHQMAALLGMDGLEGPVEVVFRAGFFGLNLFFNGVMWTLFTTALARGNSTTQVSILNTSSNFMLTAVLGFAIFSEALPPLWWAGAAMLVAGNVIVGRKDEAEAVVSAGVPSGAAVETVAAEAEAEAEVAAAAAGQAEPSAVGEGGVLQGEAAADEEEDSFVQVTSSDAAVPVEKDDEHGPAAVTGDADAGARDERPAESG